MYVRKVFVYLNLFNRNTSETSTYIKTIFAKLHKTLKYLYNFCFTETTVMVFYFSSNSLDQYHSVLLTWVSKSVTKTYKKRFVLEIKVY